MKKNAFWNGAIVLTALCVTLASCVKDPSDEGEGETSKKKHVMNGHEYVDLGLPSGLMWATCNVGASSPEGYGDFFAWGETSPKESYTWDTYKWGTGSNPSKYNETDNKTTLDLADDAARQNWGGGWRMPTKEEWDELWTNCSKTWTAKEGVNGYLLSGTNGNSLFLPAAGHYGGFGANENGSYWSSSFYTYDPNRPDHSWKPERAFYVNIGSFFVVRDGHDLRYMGNSVRPVCLP